jgi:hypothetical protein
MGVVFHARLEVASPRPASTIPALWLRMGIVAFCPQGHRVKVKDHLAGRKGICPECGTSFRIPVESSPGLADPPLATLGEPAAAPAVATAPGTSPTGTPVAKVVSLDAALAATLPRAIPLAVPEGGPMSG